MTDPWSELETLALVNAWAAEAAKVQALRKPKGVRKQSAAIYRAFLRLAGVEASDRPLSAVTERRNALKYQFEHIRSFNEAHTARGRPTWFQLSPAHRVRIYRSWKGKHVKNDMTWKVFAAMTRRFAALPIALGTRPVPEKEGDEDGDGYEGEEEGDNNDAPSSHRTWRYSEVMALARAFTKVCSMYPEYARRASVARSVEMYATWLRYGGLATRSARAVESQVRCLLDVYRFIVAFNAQACANGEAAWHHQSDKARTGRVAVYDGNKHMLQLMDAAVFSMFDRATSIQDTMSAPNRRRKRSSPSSLPPCPSQEQKRLKTKSTETRDATESRHYSVSSRRDVVTMDKTLNVSSGRLADSDSDESTWPSSGSSDDGRFQETRQEVGILRRQHDGHSKVKSTFRPFRKRRPALRTTRNDYLSLLEHTVTTMSTQLAQIDRRLTEERISENQRMLVSVLRACRQSPSFGSAPVALAREMLARAGDNLEQIVSLVGQQQQKDGELLRRLLSSIAETSA